MTEGVFPKVNGEIFYASEANTMAGCFQTVEAAETIAVGNVVYVHLTDGKMYVGGTGAADDIRATGIAVTSGTVGQDVTLQTRGRFITSGLTDKEDYYLGAAGAISTTRSGVRIGTALSTTELFINIVQDDKDAVGTVKAYLKSFTGIPSNNIAAFWVECNGQSLSDTESVLNGQTIPDLNGSGGTKRILRGSTTSGTTNAPTYSGTTSTVGASSGNGGSGPHAHTFSGSVVDSDTYEVVWIMKVK